MFSFLETFSMNLRMVSVSLSLSHTQKRKKKKKKHTKLMIYETADIVLLHKYALT